MSRAGALIAAAIAAGVLYVAGALALGSPPDAADSPAQVLAWFREHRDAARTYAWTVVFGTVAFAVLAAIVRGLLPKPHADVFLLGATAFVLETAIQAWLWAALALHPETLQPETARTVLDVALRRTGGRDRHGLRHRWLHRPRRGDEPAARRRAHPALADRPGRLGDGPPPR